MPRARAKPPLPWAPILLYGGFLAVGTVALQWLDYLWVARAHSGEVLLGLVAAAFLALGLFVGARALRPAAPTPFDGNPRAQIALGISDRERAVLEALSAGRSNKEIARDLRVSPNTVKTHVSRLYEKLEVGRRTEAIAKARALGLLP